MKHNERCPACGRFVERDADGFYDRLDRNSEISAVHLFCDEACADLYHNSHAQDHRDAAAAHDREYHGGQFERGEW